LNQRWHHARRTIKDSAEAPILFFKTLDEVEARALKQALSLQLDHLLKEKEPTKTQMATRMKTSRAAVDRLLNSTNSSSP
jgi:hypothetical protein